MNFIKTKQLKINFVLILIIVLLSGFLRFYNLSGLHNFSYDQARDALYIKRMIVDHKFRLIGTQSSIPGLYTPPFYYYLMLPFLLVSNLNPLGLDYATAFFGVATAVLIFFVLLKLAENKYLSFLIAIFYSLQPAIVYQSRFAWNPNTIPFFVLLAVFSMLKISEDKYRLIYYFVFFFSLGMTINLHYSGVIFTLVAILSLLMMTKFNWKNLLLGSSVLIFETVPLLLFDFKHNFVNIRGIVNYFTVGIKNNVPPPPFFLGVIDKYKSLVGLLVPVNVNVFLFNVSIIMFTVILVFFIHSKKDRTLIILSFIFLVSVVLSSFYQRGFFFFYLTFLFPLPFLLLGRVSGLVKKSPVKVIIYAVLITLSINNFVLSFNQTKGKLKSFDKQLREVAAFLSQKVVAPYNLVSIYLEPERFGYNAVDYRYYLETFYKKTCLDWDPVDYQNAQNLYVISEIGEVDPLKLNIWEVETFSPRLLNEKWQVNGINIYHLIK